MTQEEIDNYNCLCAKFLGWKECLTHMFDRYGYCQTVDGYITPFINTVANPRILDYNQTSFEHSIYDLQFHSDWNWIHEVVEAIEKLKFNVRITCACITIETTADNNSNLRTIFKFHSMGGEFDTKKEAVVQAINQFLIWYNENKTN